MAKKNFITKVSLIALARTFNAIGVILAGAILSRAISKSDYGIYQQIWLIFATLLPLFLLGLPYSVYYFYAQFDNQQKKTFIQQILIIGFVLATVFSLFFWLGSSILERIFKSNLISHFLPLFSIYVFSATFINFIDPILICIERQKVLLAITILYVILFISGVWWAGFVKSDLGLILIVIGIAGAVKLAFFLFYLSRFLSPIKLKFDFRLLREQIIYSFPLGMNALVAFLAKGLNKLLIAAFFSSAQYAIYANGAIEIPLVPIIMGSVVSVLVPEFSALFAKKDYNKILALWHQAIKKVSLIILPVFVLFWILAEEIIIILFSARYVESAIYFRIFLLMLPLRCFLESPLLMAGNQTKKIFYGALADVIFNFILGYYLVQKIGAIGPAITIVIATFLQISYYLWEAKQLLKNISIKKFLPYKEIIILFVVFF